MYFECSRDCAIVGLSDEFNKTPPVTWGAYEKKNPISFVVYVTDGVIDFLEASATISE